MSVEDAMLMYCIEMRYIFGESEVVEVSRMKMKRERERGWVYKKECERERDDQIAR